MIVATRKAYEPSHCSRHIRALLSFTQWTNASDEVKVTIYNSVQILHLAGLRQCYATFTLVLLTAKTASGVDNLYTYPV